MSKLDDIRAQYERRLHKVGATYDISPRPNPQKPYLGTCISSYIHQNKDGDIYELVTFQRSDVGTVDYCYTLNEGHQGGQNG